MTVDVTVVVGVVNAQSINEPSIKESTMALRLSTVAGQDARLAA